LQRLDAAEVDRLLGAWVQARAATLGAAAAETGLRAVAAAGKSLCGSGSAAAVVRPAPGPRRRRYR
jgi:hypothetical protein